MSRPTLARLPPKPLSESPQAARTRARRPPPAAGKRSRFWRNQDTPLLPLHPNLLYFFLCIGLTSSGDFSRARSTPPSSTNAAHRRPCLRRGIIGAPGRSDPLRHATKFASAPSSPWYAPFPLGPCRSLGMNVAVRIAAVLGSPEQLRQPPQKP